MKPKLSHQPRENLKYLWCCPTMNKLKFLKNGIFKAHKEIGGILKQSPYNPKTKSLNNQARY
ncbi:hypothetical protein HpMS217_03020 [Helicobacter pylori]